MPQYQNNPIANAVDGNAESKFFSSRNTQVNDYVMLSFGAPKFIDTVYLKQGGDDKFNSSKLYYTTDDVPSSRNTQVNDYVMLSFGAPKFIDTVYLKQGGDDKFNSSKLYYTTDDVPSADGKWTELTQVNDYVMLSFGAPKFIDTVYLKQGGDDKFNSSKLYYTTDDVPSADGKWTELPAPTSASEQTITFDRVEATGVKFVSTAATGNWFQLFEFNAFEKFSYSKDSLYASFDLSGVNLAARVGDGSFKTTDGSVALPKKGDVIAVDLGSVRREVVLANADAQVAKGAELVYSQNGIEWSPLKGADPVRARYVGYRATADAASVDFKALTGSYLQDAASVDFKALTGSYLHSLAPSIVKSELPGAQTLDAAKIFDGNVATATHLASLRASCPAPRPSTPPRSSTATSPPPPSPAVAPPRAPRSFSTWARSARSRALSTSSPRPVSITSAMP